MVTSAFFLDIEADSAAADALVSLTELAVDNLNTKLG